MRPTARYSNLFKFQCWRAKSWQETIKCGLVPSVGLIAICAALSTPAAAGTLQSVSIVEFPNSQASTTTPYAINNAGEIAGQYVDPSVGYRVFSLSGGAYNAVDPGPMVAVNGSSFASLNNGGQILGFANTSTPPDFGYYYVAQTGSSITPFPPAGAVIPAGASFSAYNDNGTIAGETGAQAFISEAGTVTYVGPPGSTSTVINAINDTGGLVGQFDPVTPSNPLVNQEAFLYVGGVYTTLVPPNSVFVEATGVNDLGEAAGYFEETPIVGSNGIQITPTLGFTYLNGMYSEYSVPGAVDTELFGINDSSQVVGSYGDEAGIANGFSAIAAVPEPSTWVLMFAGIGGAGLALRRTKRKARASRELAPG